MIIGSGSRRFLTHIDDPHIRIRFRRCFLQQWEKGCREDAGREVTGGNASWKSAMEAAVLLFHVFVLRDLLYDHGVLDSVRTERVIIENSIESIGRIGYS